MVQIFFSSLMPTDKGSVQRKGPFSGHRFDTYKAQRKLNKFQNINEEEQHNDKSSKRKIANRLSAAEFRKRTKDEAIFLRQQVSGLLQ